MPTIATNGAFTLINIFDVEPENVEPLIARLREVTEATMQFLPGFISTSVHRGVDGMTVANYAQWATEADFKAIMRLPEVRAHFDDVKRLTTRITPHLYRVDYAFGRKQEG